MPPYGLGLYSLADTPEELLSEGYGSYSTEFAEDPAFGMLKSNTSFNPAPYTGPFPFQNVFRINKGQYYGDLDFPSFGGVSGYRDTGGIMGIDVAPTSLGFDTSYGVANEEDEEQVESLVEEEPSGIQKLIKTALRFAVPGLSFLENRGQPYQQFSPGTTIRNGIVSVAGVNTPYSAFGGDFYNPNTGLNRFDRARNKFNETRSLKDLFGASRTLAEFNNARKILEAQKKSGYKSDFMDRPRSERNYTGPSGGDNTGGDIGSKGAADSFSNRSGMGRTGY
jgi:hypothetical protein